MRPFTAPTHSLQHASPNHNSTQSCNIERSAQADLTQLESRRDTQMLIVRTISADPYRAWLEQREAEREREARRFDAHRAWEDLKTQTFPMVGLRHHRSF